MNYSEFEAIEDAKMAKKRHDALQLSREYYSKGYGQGFVKGVFSKAWGLVLLILLAISVWWII